MKRLQKNDGFTLIELLIVVAIIGIIAAIAVPGLLRARMSGNETSAIGGMRATNTAEVSYSSACGNGAYAVLYSVLGTAPMGGTQAFISEDLGAGGVTPLKSGFTYTLGASSVGGPGPMDCNGAVTDLSFYATASPGAAGFGSTGNRSFATSAAGAVWQNFTATPPVEVNGVFGGDGSTIIQ